MPTLYELMQQHAEHRPEKLALISEHDGTRTYAELVENEARLAHAFTHELGFAPGERSCIWMWNRPEFVEVQHAAAAVGLPPVLANPEWADAEMEFVLEHSHARFIVCEPELAERALALARRIDSLDCVITLGDSVPEGALSLIALRDAAPLLPEGPAVELLRGAGAHFVVVRPSWRSPEQLEPAGMIPLTRRSGYDIYDLSAISPGPRPRGSR